MAIFTKPENALKRADELINVGQKQDALQVLHGVITSKSYRSWQKSHEQIMFRFVELCVELRSVQYAKDGLIQYRNTGQQVNISSFEEVFKHYLHLATEKVEQARTLEEEALDVDDLEADKKPEDLQLSIVTGEKGKDGSDRELVTPWLKFLWETYRSVLEIVKNNSKLEALYAMTAHKAFQFCKQYKRTKEFRRLCDMIRNHLSNLNKYRDQRNQPDLTAPESLQLYLDTRFEQLKVSTELGLWQEAFRSVEDIYGLMCMVNKTPKSSLLVVYYSKLTEIFWNSSSHLYHAYAWFKLFSLQKNFNKNLNQKDLQLIASSVILAALSVPPYGQSHCASHLELENEKELNLRMSNLIGFNLEPKSKGRDMLSRASLLSELVSRGVLSCATQEVKDLYHLLEHNFHPLGLGSKIKPLMDRISKLGGKLSSAPSLQEVHLSQYVPSLEKIATLKLLQQVSKIYQTITVKNLAQLVPFFDFSAVETIAVDAVRNNFVAMKVDHMNGVVLFGNLSIESDVLKDPLTIFAETMNKVRAMLFPAPSKTSKLGDTLPNLGETVSKEHKRLLARKSVIEKRKEEQERQQLEMEYEEEQRKLKLLKLTAEAEQKRLTTELEERRRQRILREMEERKLEEAKALLEETEKRQTKGKKRTLFDGEKVTKQTVMERAVSDKRKEDQEREKKLRKLAKTMDYLERGKREEASPLIEAAYQQRLVDERKFYEREEQREVELCKERHENDLMEKNRLARPKMLDSKEVFQERVISLRQVEFDRIRMEKEERIGQIIRARKEERNIKRKRIYHLNSEEKRINKLREEEEARKREETEKRRKEEAERKAKLDEMAEKQRQRERDLEEKKRLMRETLLKPTDAFPARSLEPRVAATADGTAHSQSPAKYVSKFRRNQTTEVSGSASALPPAEKPDQWTSGRKIRSDLNGSEQPGGDAWRSEEGRSAFGNSSSRSSFTSRTWQRCLYS